MKAEIKSVKTYQVKCPECGHLQFANLNKSYVCENHKNHLMVQMEAEEKAEMEADGDWSEDEIKAYEALQSVINAVQSGVPYRLKGLELEACEYEELTHLAISKKTVELVVKTLKDMRS